MSQIKKKDWQTLMKYIIFLSHKIAQVVVVSQFAKTTLISELCIILRWSIKAIQVGSIIFHRWHVTSELKIQSFFFILLPSFPFSVFLFIFPFFFFYFPPFRLPFWLSIFPFPFPSLHTFDSSLHHKLAKENISLCPATKINTPYWVLLNLLATLSC